MASPDDSPPIAPVQRTPTAGRGRPAATSVRRPADASVPMPPEPKSDKSDGTGPAVAAHRRTEVHAPANLRRALLFHLRREGPSTPDQLAGRIGASRTGVLQQLRALEAAHLVTKETIRHGVGRPRHVYDVAPAAQDLFPANYDGLAAGLLAAIQAVGGPALVEEVFAARRRQLGVAIRERVARQVGPDAPLVARVRELAVIQDEQGYLAEAIVGPDDAIRLHEHNCAIYRVARTNPAACEAELALFREVLGAEVERETHIAAGDRCCTYRITQPSGS